MSLSKGETKSVNCLEESRERHHDSHNAVGSPLAAELSPWTICRLCLIQFNSLEQWRSNARSKKSFQVRVNHSVDILCWKSGQKLQCLQQSTKVCEVCKLKCFKYQNSKDVKEIVLWSIACLYQLRVQPNLVFVILQLTVILGRFLMYVLFFLLYVTIKLFLYARPQALHFF